MTKALVVGSGGLKGAFGAGVLAEWCRIFGPNYFDAVFASSVGVFAGTFYLANQPDTIEHTWRHLVDGKKLVNPLNVLFRRAILDLDYLVDAFQEEKSKLDVKAVFESPSRLIYVVTDFDSGEPVYIEPTPQNIFQLMRASSAVPFVYKPVQVDGRTYLDGALSDDLPVEQALAEGFDRVVVITNKPRGHTKSAFGPFSKFISPFLPSQIQTLLKRDRDRVRNDGGENLEGVFTIRPDQNLLLRSAMDSNKHRLNETVQMGIEATRSVAGILANTT